MIQNRALIWLILVTGLARAAGAQGLSGRCVFVTPPATGNWADQSVEPAIERTLQTQMRVGANIRIRTGPDNRATLYLQAGDQGRPAEASVYLQADTEVQICPGGDPRRRVALVGGSVVVSYAARDRQPLVLTTESAWARLEGGTLIATLRNKTVTFALAEGKASAFDAKLPDDVDPAKVPGGKVIKPKAAARQEADKLTVALTQMSLLAASEKWLAHAERPDLVPMPREPESVAREAAALTVAVAPVDQAMQVSPVTIATVTSPVTQAPVQAPTQVQSLLTSGDPASVIVGARLQRTRIVGNPGTAATGTGVRANPQVRGPLGSLLRR